MSFFLMFHWGWLAGAALIGFAMGWISIVQHGDGLSLAAMRRIAVAGVVVAGIAAARLLPGRYGYWLDLGLVMIAAYLLGCVLGAWLRERIVSRGGPAADLPDA